MSKKEALVQTAKDILWLKGYEAMSPADVLAESGAGKGSMYHHFSGKEALALAALEEVEEDLCAMAKGILYDTGSPLKRIKRFLNLKRQATRGCRLGRVVNEQSVIESSLVEPVKRYFTKLSNMLEDVLVEGIEAGELADDVDVKSLSLHIIATVQGGFVISRGKKDPKAMQHAVKSMCHYLDCLVP